jgi:hypothetical protein
MLCVARTACVLADMLRDVGFDQSAKGGRPATFRPRFLGKRIFTREVIRFPFGEFAVESCGLALRANIRETPVVLLINEQGEKEKGRDEWHFS